MWRWLVPTAIAFACRSTPLTELDGMVSSHGGETNAAGGAQGEAGERTGSGLKDVCDELSLSRSPLASATGLAFGDVAGDFAVTMLDESRFHYATDRTGCESYLFLNYIPDLRARPAGPWSGDTLWDNSNPSPFIAAGPRNTQYFFTSEEADLAARRARLQKMQRALEAALTQAFDDETEREFWRGRFHFVSDRSSEIEGSVGAHYRDYLDYLRTPESVVDLGERGKASAPLPFFFGIDRHQRFHAGDDLSPFVGGKPHYGMAAYAGHYYNHLFEIEQRLAADAATVVPIVDDERTTARVFNRLVSLPDATALAGFNHLEVEVEVECEERNVYACSEWDRIAGVHVCLDPDCSERRELARWITPYWRRGPQHWSIDASALLPLLSAGGDTRFLVETGPAWERATEYRFTAALRFSSVVGAPTPAGAVPIFAGGTFDETYNDREPVRVDIPASATRVELVTILTGHGQAAVSNCAEWCDHRHVFSVNGSKRPAVTHDGEIGRPLGCAARAADGVPPNQGGNWAAERAYWCPGLPVEARRDDITQLAVPGSTAVIAYQAFYGAASPAGGEIALSAYVVWYE